MAGGDTVQQIKERLSILDVVAPYVELHKAGKNYKGRSPFTAEKTPSFFVSPDKGMYYCFSSSQGGDMFTFIQSMEGVEFKEALKILADKAGVELVPEDPKKRSERDTGYAILEEATRFFEGALTERADARAYLRDRGVTDETRTKWRIGYAPGPPQGGWRELRAHLSEMKHTDAELMHVGLIKRTEDGKEPYDVFRDRVMFPIFDSAGRPVAFSGRILAKDTEAPKYVNSPESEFFNKSEILYGYDRAKQGIRSYDFSLIVEGQFDVVLSHQAGYTNTVAVSGTALTPHHVGLLQRLSNRVVLALDADRAGIAAVKRAAELMLARGIDLKVARLPDGEDPADIIESEPKRYKEVIAKASHVIEFLLAVLKEGVRDERTYKLRVREEVLPYIVSMQNSIDAEHFEGVVAAAIGTTTEAVHLETVRLREEAKQRKDSAFVETGPVAAAGPEAKSDRSRRDSLSAYMAVAAGLVESSIGGVVADVLKKCTGRSAEDIIAGLSPQEQSELMFTIESEFEDMQERHVKQELNAKIHELTLLTLRHELKEKKELLYQAEREGAEDVVAQHLADVSELQKRLAGATDAVDIFGGSNL